MNTKNASDLGEFINIGAGEDVQMKDLLNMVKQIVGFDGKIEFDSSKPNGVFRKLLDGSHMNALGIRPKQSMQDGIRNFYKWYLDTLK